VVEVDSHPEKTPEGSRTFSLISAVVKVDGDRPYYYEK
jgi:hypothetical protein